MPDAVMDAEVVMDDELMFDDPLGPSLLRRERSLANVVREGEVLAGKYRVERIPGRAGLGVIAQVRHLELGQEVTLKFLIPDACAYPEFVQRFIREARAAVKIGGEHVARVTDVGRLDSGAPYMVREYLRGPDLAEVLKVRGPLPISEAVDYIVQAAEGVAEGHALGIVHRNLRPTTLVVCRRSDGSPLVKVFDFAAAETLHVDPFTERAVSLVGTSAIMASLPYLSPEQIRDPLDVDARADVYALGAILHELLTGSPVYRGDNAPSLLASVAADVAPSVRNLRSDAPGDLDHVVLRCLAKNRAIRYSTMGELVAALAPFASSESAGSVERVMRLARQSAVPRQPARPEPVRHDPPRSEPTHVMPAPEPLGRGPTGTLMIPKVPQPTRIAPVINDDVTVTQPLHTYEPLAEERAIKRTPLPPPIERRRSMPPAMPLTPPPPPAVTVSATETPAPAASPRSESVYAPPHRPPPSSQTRTTMMPPSRSSLPGGMSRSWIPEGSEENTTISKLKSKRMLGIGAVAACSVLGLLLGLRATSGAPAPVAAAKPLPAAAPAPPPPAPPPPAQVAPEPPAAASASAAPVVSAAPAAPVAAPPAATAPVVTPPAARAVAPVAAPARAAAPPPVARAAAAPAAPRQRVDEPASAKVAVATPGRDLFASPD